MPPTDHSIPPFSMALTIAGSDPSGGAGIQADIKTFTLFGVACGAAVSCLTAQNSLGVSGVVPVSPEFVAEQIGRVLDDLPVTHIKIGMVGEPRVAEAIAAALAGFAGQIVYDPVLRASTGDALAVAGLPATLRTGLLKLATVLTPNRHELEVLAGHPVTNRQEALEAAAHLLENHLNLEALVVKGGHLEETEASVEDTLLVRQRADGTLLKVSRTHPRRTTRNTHGTGCTFASAYTACHLLYGCHEKAFAGAVDFLDRLLEKSARHAAGAGNLPLLHHLMVADCRKTTSS